MYFEHVGEHTVLMARTDVELKRLSHIDSVFKYLFRNLFLLH